MNMRSIAKLAGVSLSTVSKAFSGSHEISEKTRQRVFDIAKEYGLYDIYNKNKFEKKVIAVIAPEVVNDFYAQAITILKNEIDKRNCIMLLSINDFNADMTDTLISYYTAYCRVDGIICMTPCKDLTNPSLIPGVVIFGGNNTCDGWTKISTDIYASMKEAVFTLKELGHTDIGFACENVTKGKLNDFKRAMRAAALPIREEWIVKTRARFEDGGAEIAGMLARSGRLPTAVIASNDYKAIGIIDEFRKHGIRVPDDVSVIGIDDIRQAANNNPPLSTIRTSFEEVCRTCVDVIYKKIDNQYYSPLENIVLSTKLIMRRSVCEVRHESESAEKPV